jgi:hypothetical protein
MQIYSKVFVLLFFSLNTYSSGPIINVTGTYVIDSTLDGQKISDHSYSAVIIAKVIDSNKIIVNFSINIGPPSYNTGSFFDTLQYKNNVSIYKTDSKIDSTCSITFRFVNGGVYVKEMADNYNWGCGFGHGVVANGYFKKVSIKYTDLFLDPSTGQLIK